jgi:hypothetical protein
VDLDQSLLPCRGDEAVGLGDLRKDAKRLLGQSLAREVTTEALASSHVVVASRGRIGAGKTEFRRGPINFLASTSHALGPTAGSPIGMSTPTIASSPESRGSATSVRLDTSATDTVWLSGNETRTTTHPSRQPSTPATSGTVPDHG